MEKIFKISNTLYVLNYKESIKNYKKTLNFNILVLHVKRTTICSKILQKIFDKKRIGSHKNNNQEISNDKKR